MEFWGRENLGSTPTKHVLPSGIMHQSLDKTKENFHTVVGEFIDKYVMSDPDKAIDQYKEWPTHTRDIINMDHDFAMKPTHDELNEPNVDFPPESQPINTPHADRVR